MPFPHGHKPRIGETYSIYHHVVDEIADTYGKRVRIGRKTLHKYGRNENAGTSDTLISYMNQNETYVATNAITHISSASAGDTQLIYVEGMTISSNALTFVSQYVTLSGQTKVALSTPLARVTRVVNSGTTDLAGDVYVYEDDTVVAGVPQTATKLHARVKAGKVNRTLKAATSIVDTNFFVMTFAYGYINKKTTASADIAIYTRQLGSVFNLGFVVPASTDNGFIMAPPNGYLIIPPNTDIEQTSVGSTTAIDISCGFGGFFADIIGDV